MIKNISSLYLLILTILFISCKSNHEKNTTKENERICDCPMKNLPDEKISTDSTITRVLKDDLYDWKIGGKISGEIKKILDIEINASINSPIEKNYTVSTKKVIEKVSNNFPQLIYKSYEFKLGRIFYCTYYAILCQDTTISDTELRIKSTEKLEEFRKETTNIIKKNEIIKIKKQTSPKIVTSNKGDNNKYLTSINSVFYECLFSLYSL